MKFVGLQTGNDLEIDVVKKIEKEIVKKIGGVMWYHWSKIAADNFISVVL